MFPWITGGKLRDKNSPQSHAPPDDYLSVWGALWQHPLSVYRADPRLFDPPASSNSHRLTVFNPDDLFKDLRIKAKYWKDASNGWVVFDQPVFGGSSLYTREFEWPVKDGLFLLLFHLRFSCRNGSCRSDTKMKLKGTHFNSCFDILNPLTVIFIEFRLTFQRSKV